jgi:choline-sulfatase
VVATRSVSRFSRRIPIASLVAASFPLGLIACGGAPGHPPVVLISIDTLRADHLPAWGYRGVATPAIDALARDAVRFTSAYAQYPLTLPSHASFLTGLLPPRDGVRDNIGYALDGAAHPTLARRLAGSGYVTGGFVSSYVLRRETGIGDGFGVYDAPGPGPRAEILDLAQRPGTVTVAAARAWLDRERFEAANRPFFLFVHLYEPHAPYAPPEPFRSRYPGAPYDGEVATADAAVGELLDDLRARGLYDRCVVALVSDHGEGLGEHGESKHGVFLYRTTLHVPMLIRLPGARRAGAAVDSPVGLVDLVPTLLAAAGLDVPDGLDGFDVLADGAGGPPADRGLYAETFYPRLHFGWSDLRAWTEKRWSLVDGPAPELFDLAADPGQIRDVLVGERRQYARMREEIARRDLPLAPPAAVDAATAAKLAALGYLTGAVAAGHDRLPDPRTQRDLLAALEAGADAYFAGDDPRALDLLRRVLARNPDMRDVWSMVARSLDRQGRTAEALAAWDRLLELSAGDAGMTLLVGERHLAAGDVERARGLAEAAATAEPERAEELLAEVDFARGDGVAGRAKLEKAVASGHASETARRRLALDALASGSPERAVELLAPTGDEGEPESWILLALALSDAGRQQEGLDRLEQARRASRPEASFYENLGVALLALERHDKARAALEQAVKLAPGAASAWNALGVACARSGDARGALAAWRRAVGADPSLADAWFNLGLTAAEAGQRQLARQALGRFLALAPADGPRAGDRQRAQRALGALGGGS